MTYPLVTYDGKGSSGSSALQFTWFKPGSNEESQFCYQDSTTNKYSILRFGLLFCTDNLPVEKDFSGTADQFNVTALLACDPLLDVCRSWNYTVTTLSGGIKTFTFSETEHFEVGKAGSVNFTGLCSIQCVLIKKRRISE